MQQIIIHRVRPLAIRPPMLAQSLPIVGEPVLHRIRPFSGRRQTTDYCVDNGWLEGNGSWFGYYRAAGREFPGQVMAKHSITDPFRFYIYDPPAEFLHGPHRLCFHREDGNRYWIHFSKKPKDITSGIAKIESHLAQVLGNPIN